MIKRVGIIGVGAMGEEMARHLIEKGFEVIAYDIDSNRLERAKSHGARVSSDIKSLAENSECSIVMVATDAQVVDAVGGEKGILAGAAAGHIIVVCSSTNPRTCQRLAKEVSAKQLYLLDAPVVFGLQGAKEGRLKSLVGGSEEAVDKIRPVLGAFCADVIHMGPVGHGQITKTANNMLHWTMIVANYEVLSLAKRLNIHPARMREVLLQCPAANGSLEHWLSHKLTWPQKDMDTAMELAQEVNLPMPLHGLVDQLIMQLTPKVTHGLILDP
jgi:3-hydroxyisobutyrate dehydrogenase